MAEEGLSSKGNLLGRQPDVPSSLSDIYNNFYLLDRDGLSGRVTVQSMRELMDEMEITDRVDRMRVIRFWRGMDVAQASVRREAEEAKRPNKRRGK